MEDDTWNRGAAYMGAGALAVGREGRPGYRAKRNWLGRWAATLVSPAE